MSYFCEECGSVKDHNNICIKCNYGEEELQILRQRLDSVVPEEEW